MFSFAQNYTVQNPFWNQQECPKFINVIIENNPSHKSGAKSTLCNVAMKISLLSSHIFIHTCPFCFAVTWCPSVTSMCLSVSYNEPGIKYKISGVMWHVAPESKSNWSIAKCRQYFHYDIRHYQTYVPYMHISLGRCYLSLCRMYDYLLH